MNLKENVQCCVNIGGCYMGRVVADVITNNHKTVWVRVVFINRPIKRHKRKHNVVFV